MIAIESSGRTMFALLFGGLLSTCTHAQTAATMTTPLTPPGAFTDGIEGPAYGPDGFLYVVNYQSQGTIGKTAPNGTTTTLLTLPGGGVGNGIRFGVDGSMYIADYVSHTIWKRGADGSLSVHCHDDRFHQPNDMTIAADGTIYASDPDWPGGGGRVWRITPDGVASILIDNLSLPNGIELAPDGTTLYVGQTKPPAILRYVIDGDDVGPPETLIAFDDALIDGIRCDVDGNVHAARYDAGCVAVVSPLGVVLKQIDTLGCCPSNLAFGGPDGRTVHVTEVSRRRIVTYRSDAAGAALRLISSPRLSPNPAPGVVPPPAGSDVPNGRHD